MGQPSKNTSYRITPNQSAKGTAAPVPNPHPVEELFAKTTVRHQLGAGHPEDQPASESITKRTMLSVSD